MQEHSSPLDGGQPYRSGVVAVIGPPNAGKSTLLNQFLGQKIAIVTPKPQTTRNRILGIITGTNYQIIMLDTPGLHRAREMLNKEMVRIALETLNEADVVLFLADAAGFSGEKLDRQREEYTKYLEKVQCPVVLALNKVDLLEKDALLPLIDWYSRLYPFEELVPISALTGEGTDVLLDSLVAHLPPGPQYYPDDIPTDASVRFIVAEIIREKVFLRTKQEIPYSTAVVIDAFQEGRKQEPTTIHATILVEQDSQKGIIIGKKGSMLREIGKSARLDIEELIDQRVMLKLWVKVKKKWTKNESVLRELGLSGSGG
jgi:GTP-binding protein Era